MANYNYIKTPQLEAGKGYRFAIDSIEEKTSRNGNPMLVVTLKPNGIDKTINHYIVQNEHWNDSMTRFCGAFGINDQPVNIMTWPGAVGAAIVKEDDYGFKIARFLSPEQAASLPPWIGEMPERVTVESRGFAETETDDLPF